MRRRTYAISDTSIGLFVLESTGARQTVLKQANEPKAILGWLIITSAKMSVNLKKRTPITPGALEKAQDGLEISLS
jgi:hypothetical protein